MSALRTLLAVTAATALMWAQGCDRTINMVDSSPDGQPLSCAECHDSSNLITGKQTEWAESVHGTGTAYLRGTSASCAGCHSGNGFVERLAMGLDVDEVENGDPDPTRQDCRACHMIHSTYTEADFALQTEAAVALYAVEGVVFDGGEGNLCVNCHQPRRVIPAAVNGIISGITSHWGPHHGPQSAMLLGVAGAGVPDAVSGHYGAVANSCVDCHMGEGRNHHFEPAVANCIGCHPDIEDYDDFDYKNVQSETEVLVNQLGDLLLQANLINENSPDGHPTVTSTEEDNAVALWNWIYVAHEDKSMGVHNPGYARAMLEEGIRRMGGTPVTLP